MRLTFFVFHSVQCKYSQNICHILLTSVYLIFTTLKVFIKCSIPYISCAKTNNRGPITLGNRPLVKSIFSIQLIVTRILEQLSDWQVRLYRLGNLRLKRQ